MTCVLIVDDEYDLLHTVEAALELLGYETVCAGDGREGLECARKRLPDMVLSDVMMPYMTGYDLVDALRGLPGGRELPIALMSSIDPALHPADGRWNEVLVKPFTLDRLLAVVERLAGPATGAPAAG